MNVAKWSAAERVSGVSGAIMQGIEHVARERSERTSKVNVAKRSAAERVSGVSGARDINTSIT